MRGPARLSHLPVPGNELRASLELTALEGGRGHLGQDVQYDEAWCLPLDSVPLETCFLNWHSASLCTAGSPDLSHKTSKTGPYLETPREKGASSSPRTRSSDHKRCLRSCRGSRRLCHEPWLVESRGTNGLGTPSSPRQHSQGLRRGVRREVNLSLAGVVLLYRLRPPLSIQTQPGALPDSRVYYGAGRGISG